MPFAPVTGRASRWPDRGRNLPGSPGPRPCPAGSTLGETRPPARCPLTRCPLSRHRRSLRHLTLRKIGLHITHANIVPNAPGIK